jgi:16S rRNA (uracil1498-N3)-methyltransferase
MRVRRARAGDAVELVDGQGLRAPGRIESIGADETIVVAGTPESIPAEVPRIRAVIPWIKGDRMELCVEKLVEVGVDDIAVFAAARAVVHLDGARLAARIGKLQATAAAAARQSGRAAVPGISVTDLASAGAGTCVVLVPGAERAEPTGDAVTIASGPEGGWDPDELERLVRAGWIPMGLGRTVLRAETAPVIAVAMLRLRGAT